MGFRTGELLRAFTKADFAGHDQHHSGVVHPPDEVVKLNYPDLDLIVEGHLLQVWMSVEDHRDTLDESGIGGRRCAVINGHINGDVVVSVPIQHLDRHQGNEFRDN